MVQTILYFGLAFLVALLGIGKRGGFLLHLVVAIALTPVAGIIMALLAPDVVKPGKGDAGRAASK